MTAPDGVRIACAYACTGPPLVKAPTWLSHVGMDNDSPAWRHWSEALARDHFFGLLASAEVAGLTASGYRFGRVLELHHLDFVNPSVGAELGRKVG